MATKEEAKSISFVEDTAVAPEKLSEFIGKFLKIVASHGTTAGVYAHASVGCLHVRPVVNMKTEEGVRKFESIATQVADLVLEYGGALSGEHGDGYVRSPFMRKMFGDTLYEAFRDVKRTFDPQGILNPGKIVDAPPLTTNLRYGTAYRATNPASTYFDYSDYGGFAEAVEMCSGVGACRKNAGRQHVSFLYGHARGIRHHARPREHAAPCDVRPVERESGLADDAVYKVLDLCLECRACKAECPVNVDMARYKSEFLAALLREARYAIAREGARRRGQAFRRGQCFRPAIELGRRQRLQQKTSRRGPAPAPARNGDVTRSPNGPPAATR